MSNKLRITWVKSAIGHKKEHRLVLKSLGFHRLHETVEHDDSPSIRGMVHKVSYMLKVENVD